VITRITKKDILNLITIELLGVIEVGVTVEKTKLALPKTKMWAVEECPACQSEDISTNYFTGEVFCLKCGLVIY
jgi:hypothetical protein